MFRYDTNLPFYSLVADPTSDANLIDYDPLTKTITVKANATKVGIEGKVGGKLAIKLSAPGGVPDIVDTVTPSFFANVKYPLGTVKLPSLVDELSAKVYELWSIEIPTTINNSGLLSTPTLVAEYSLGTNLAVFGTESQFKLDLKTTLKAKIDALNYSTPIDPSWKVTLSIGSVESGFVMSGVVEYPIGQGTASPSYTINALIPVHKWEVRSTDVIFGITATFKGTSVEGKGTTTSGTLGGILTFAF